MSFGNTKYGDGALQKNTKGSNNSAFGICSSRDTDISWNTSLGAYANMSNVSGISNVAVGTNAHLLDVSGSYNTALGTATLLNNKANSNTAVGSNSMEKNTTGKENVAVGVQAGYENTTGEKNVFVGSYAGFNNVTGNENTFVGNNAGINVTNNISKNTFLGANTGIKNIDKEYTNSTAIGYGSIIDESNQIVLGNLDNNVLIKGTLTLDGNFNFQGFSGFTGAIGPRGDTGDKGFTGDKGLTGDLGPTGFRGDTGFRGLTGDKGLIGDLGPTGFRGDTGFRGLTGDKGLIGDLGPTGFRGDTGFRGLTGDKGPLGDLGPTGFRGDTGFRGFTGDKGLIGDLGPTGFRGDTGLQGDKGPLGDLGPTGFRGDTGFRGLTGDKGPLGDTGFRGLTGDLGPTGDKGPTGDPYTSGNFTVNGNLTVTGDVSMNSKLRVARDASFNSNVDIFGTLNVSNSDSYIRNIRIGYGSENIDNNLVIGIDSGTSNLTGEYNTFIGYESGKLNTLGSTNLFVGANSGYSNNSGDDNTFIGYNSGHLNTVGSKNLFVGANSGYYNNSGDDNTFIGNGAGYFNTIGTDNIFIGTDSGFNNTGDFNIMIGTDSGNSINSGNNNLIFGYETFKNLNVNKEYNGNLAIGNTIGTKITGNQNTFVGNNSCKNYDGSDCSFFGYDTGSLQYIGGLGNTLLGSGSNVNADDVQYSTAIGYGSFVDVSNTIVIGRSSETTKISGNIDILGISKLRNRAYQQLNSDSSWNSVNGYYGLAKDAYPALNPYSTGVQSVSTWTIRSASSSQNFMSVCWSPILKLFAAVSYDGTTNRVITSFNGFDWTLRITPNLTCNSICWSDKKGFVAVGTNVVMTSTNGTTWTQRTPVPSGDWMSVCWSDELGIFVAVGSLYISMTSEDGITWQTYPMGNNFWSYICWSAELRLFVAVNINKIYTSNDGQNWILSSNSVGSISICWSAELGLFVGVNDNLYIIISSDGVTWSQITNPYSDRYWYSVCWSAELGLFACIAYNYSSVSMQNVVMTSPDGINWTIRQTPAINTIFNQICWSPELGIFVAVGKNTSNNSILISSLKGRPPTCYNVFDSCFNEIDQNGNWNLKVKTIGNTVNSDLAINSIITVNNNINQTGTTSSTNRITQSIVSLDTNSANRNIFKHSTFNYNNSGTAISSPCIVCCETSTTTNAINFIPKTVGINPIVVTNDCVISSSNASNDSNITLTSGHSSIKAGVRISSISTTQTTVELSAGDNKIFIDSSLGMTFTTSGTTNEQKYNSLTHKFSKQDGTSGCSVYIDGSLYFTNGTTQSTAYTIANNNKLNALGTTISGIMAANSILTSGTYYSPTNIFLSAIGTYIITVNACVSVTGGTTTVGEMMAGYSSTYGEFSQNINLAILNGGSVTYNTGDRWSLNSSNVITNSLSNQTYYLGIKCTFGTASKMQYVQANSSFRTIRIV
jgi:hypothetical protein